MRTVPKWIEKIHDESAKCEQVTIHALCFHPDGEHLVVGAGDKLLIYEPTNGTLLRPLKGHKDVIYALSYAKDGKKFASGGNDKSVIIWSNKFEGILKYSHNDPILCLAFNPVSHQLASCTSSDFSFWSMEQKAVQKVKVSSRINTCAWTYDGQYLAIGLANGTVSIRNKLGEERVKIDRSNGSTSAIYGLAWSPILIDNVDSLCIVDWNQTMSFFTLGGQMIGRERNLGFDPLSVQYSIDGEFIIVSGCNKTVTLYTRDGVQLGILGDKYESWVWTSALHPKGLSIVMGCQDGTLAAYNLTFTTVHALYRERYAFRENMCDVIIQHLISGQKVRIKCRDLVHKIAIYRNRLAVQLAERVILYELNSTENQPMHYKVKEKISKKFDCSLLVVCAQHLVLCQEKKLQSLDFSGILQREWLMDSFIRYIKVIGGPPGREGLLLGLKNGQVWRIFLDNPLPIMITSVLSAVRCLDLNCTRQKLAIVDDAGRLVVRDLLNDSLLYQDSGINSVAWNTQMESMLCYSHISGGLSIRVNTLPPRSPQNMLGVVVGLSGSMAFCLRGNAMNNIPLALGATMWQFIEMGKYEDAYKIASLGVTNNDWISLAEAATEALQFKIAKDAYVKLRNFSSLELINDLKDKHKRGDISKDVLRGDCLAYGGKFKEAAKLYHQSGNSNKAVSMYSELRLFDLAQEYLKEDATADKLELIRRRAEWACSVHEPRAAVELLMAAGEKERAVEIVAEQGWPDVLLDIGRRLPITDKNLLSTIASHLKRLEALPLAAEIYRKLGAESEVVQLHVESRDWAEAFRLAADMPNVLSKVHHDHAHWLVEADQFEAAQKSYLLAGKPRDAIRLLNDLIDCAVYEERFLDASYYYWLKAKQNLEVNQKAANDEDDSINFKDNDSLEDYNKFYKMAALYYAYNTIHCYLREPFTSNMPSTLFNTSRYVANMIGNATPPKGISLFAIFYTLSKQAKSLGASKLHLQTNIKLQSLKPPHGVQDQIDMSYVISKACPGGLNDPEELLPMCYRCSNYSVHLHGNKCSNCQQEFIFSFVSFEILPLVEFFPEIGITDQEAERLLHIPPKSNEYHDDLFDGTLDADGINIAIPLSLDRDSLRAMDPNVVIIIKQPKPLRTKYYRNMLPELLISVCPSCYHAFHTEDFEIKMLQKNCCPFCRTASDVILG